MDVPLGVVRTSFRALDAQQKLTATMFRTEDRPPEGADIVTLPSGEQAVPFDSSNPTARVH